MAGYVREDSPASSQPQPGEAPTAGRVCVVDEHGEAINASGLSRDLFRVHLLALKRQDVTQALSTLHQHFDYAGRFSPAAIKMLIGLVILAPEVSPTGMKEYVILCQQPFCLTFNCKIGVQAVSALQLLGNPIPCCNCT